MTLHNQNNHWLDVVESLSVVGSIGGAITSVVLNNAAFASIPLSLSMTLNLLNRRRLLETINYSNKTAIAEVIHANTSSKTQIETIVQQLEKVEQVTHNNAAENRTEFGRINTNLTQLEQQLYSPTHTQEQNQKIAQLQQQNIATLTNVEILTQQLEQLQQKTNQLAEAQSNTHIQEYTQNLLQKQAELVKTVESLHNIETNTQTIRINPTSEEAFLSRALGYQSLGDTEAAIGDFSEAIRINPRNPKLYQNRGLAYAEIGNRKAAVKDLREAAKLFFESGDVAKYQTARDLSKKLYELDSPIKDTSNMETVQGLFAD